MSGLTGSDVRLFGLWSILLLITFLSLGSSHLGGWFTDNGFQGAAVIILAFIKVRLIILDFMEVRHAPMALRLVLEIWVGVLCTVLIVMLFQTP